MTKEEKEAYIGIYRLLRQLEKTDGAAIGALLQQGAEPTLKNLLTAVRSGLHIHGQRIDSIPYHLHSGGRRHFI